MLILLGDTSFPSTGQGGCLHVLCCCHNDLKLGSLQTGKTSNNRNIVPCSWRCHRAGVPKGSRAGSFQASSSFQWLLGSLAFLGSLVCGPVTPISVSMVTWLPSLCVSLGPNFCLLIKTPVTGLGPTLIQDDLIFFLIEV